ncbi:MAG: flagellar filament capping protein FliD [Novosphingobium sp.]
MATSPTSSVTSSLVTALGGGSGIDMTALANQLAVAQFAARTDRLTARSETLDKQISTTSSIKSMLLQLSTSLGARVRSGDLSPQPQVADPAVARASLSGGARPTGSYALEVIALAGAQTLLGPPLGSSAATVGGGTLTIRFGTVSNGGFGEDAGHSAVEVPIASGATLADVATAINASSAGVSAYVARTADGSRLVIKGQEGAANGFVVEASGEPGLAALAWAPGSAPERLAASAGDAAYKIDGIALTAPGNTVSDAVPGLNLTLTAANPGKPTRITFGDPASAISGAMNELAGALNDIATALATATDPKTGELARDAGALALKRTLAQLGSTVILPTAGEGKPRTLGDLGLKIQRDGTFALDSARLSATLAADPQGAAALFGNGLYGVFATVDGIARRAGTVGDPGTLAGSLARYTGQKTALATDRAKIADQQEALRQRLTKQFTASDSRIGAFKSTQSFLQQQIDAWNASRS